jgi:flavocytochrome c
MFAPVPDSWDETVDVVVVGSGFAGLAAAIEIHDAGATVKIVEKMDRPGGNSWINGGQVAVANSASQRAAGIVDSPGAMLADMQAAGLHLNHVALARMVAERSADAAQWTTDRCGAQFDGRVNVLGGHSVARILQTKNGRGSEIVGAQLAVLKGAGIEVETNVLLTEIYRASGGRAAGVAVRTNYTFGSPATGPLRTVRARAGIVLATGGFSRDIAFRTAQDPRLGPDLDSTNQPGATADGLIAALAAQALPVQLDWIQCLPLCSPDEPGFGVSPGFIGGSSMPYGILVDPATARRFVSELADRRVQADALLALGHPAVNICDAYGASKSWWGLDVSLERGIVKKFETLDELAAAYGIDAVALGNTIARFNGFATVRNDPEFGKMFLSDVRPILEAPFYAVRIWPKVHHTMGGIEIDAGAHVHDLNGALIPGLYAAGEVTGGVHGGCRLGGVAIVDCLVFGRIAGQTVVADARVSAGA